MAKLPRMSLYWYRRLYTQIYRKRDDDGGETPVDPIELPVILLPSSATTDKTPTISGTGVIDATVSLDFYLDAALIMTRTTTVDGSGAWSYTVLPADELIVTEYKLKAKQTVDDVDSDYIDEFTLTIDYIQQTKDFFVRVTSQPTVAYKRIYDKTFRGLVDKGILAVCPAIYAMNAVDEQTGLLNLIADPTYNLTKQGGITFVQFKGMLLNGTTGYLETHLVPTVLEAASKIGKDNVWIGIGIYVGVNSTTYFDYGTVAGTATRLMLNGFRGGGACHLRHSSTVSNLPASTTAVGRWSINRLLSTGYSFFRSLGTSIPVTQVSAAFTADAIVIGRDGSAFSARGYSYFGIGKLTAQQELDFDAIMSAHCTAMGFSIA